MPRRSQQDLPESNKEDRQGGGPYLRELRTERCMLSTT
jgi:hypothetical protein